ncbi:MAG TPA: hypothetical protein DCZ63_13025 [Geobacter sp.]|nr:hypothetical protein [Geobacter sp.]
MTKQALAICRVAKRHGYVLEQEQPEIRLLIFSKGSVQVNVYWTRMTVSTCLRHPTLGKTQLFRREVSLTLLDKIFENPRVHTDKGYRKKRSPGQHSVTGATTQEQPKGRYSWEQISQQKKRGGNESIHCVTAISRMAGRRSV